MSKKISDTQPPKKKGRSSKKRVNRVGSAVDGAVVNAAVLGAAVLLGDTALAAAGPGVLVDDKLLQALAVPDVPAALDQAQDVVAAEASSEGELAASPESVDADDKLSDSNGVDSVNAESAEDELQRLVSQQYEQPMQLAQASMSNGSASGAAGGAGASGGVGAPAAATSAGSTAGAAASAGAEAAAGTAVAAEGAGVAAATVAGSSMAPLVALGGLAFAGGGGGGGSASGGAAGAAVGGFAAKGPLNNALVFFDIDGDGKFNKAVDTVYTKTGADGSYSFSLTSAQVTAVAGKKVIVQGQYDDPDNPGTSVSATYNTGGGNVAFTGKLVTPAPTITAGASVTSNVTTFSTMKASGVSDSVISEMLGGRSLDSLDDSDFDQAGDALEAMSVKVMALLDKYTSATDSGDKAEFVMESIGKVLENLAASQDLTDPDALTAAMNIADSIAAQAAAKFNELIAADADGNIDDAALQAAFDDLESGALADDLQAVIDDYGSLDLSDASVVGGIVDGLNDDRITYAGTKNVTAVFVDANGVEYAGRVTGDDNSALSFSHYLMTEANAEASAATDIGGTAAGADAGRLVVQVAGTGLGGAAGLTLQELQILGVDELMPTAGNTVLLNQSIAEEVAQGALTLSQVESDGTAASYKMREDTAVYLAANDLEQNLTGGASLTLLAQGTQLGANNALTGDSLSALGVDTILPDSGAYLTLSESVATAVADGYMDLSTTKNGGGTASYHMHASTAEDLVAAGVDTDIAGAGNLAIVAEGTLLGSAGNPLTAQELLGLGVDTIIAHGGAPNYLHLLGDVAAAVAQGDLTLSATDNLGATAHYQIADTAAVMLADAGASDLVGGAATVAVVAHGTLLGSQAHPLTYAELQSLGISSIVADDTAPYLMLSGDIADHLAVGDLTLAAHAHPVVVVGTLLNAGTLNAHATALEGMGVDVVVPDSLDATMLYGTAAHTDHSELHALLGSYTHQ